ncbi:MAG TPA: hypothetical protein VHZ03_14250 [Trebonia sp.]|nr:hypothetical protein [Trebonia sp.]
MACDLDPDACRTKHIAERLARAEQDGSDYEAQCPACGHGGFRVSAARIRAYRHIWTCACKRCGGGNGCSGADLRRELIKLDIPAGCLGIYNGGTQKEISPEAARRMNLTISDILAAPHLKPSDMRIALAEAQGRTIPTEYAAFVKFAKEIGIGHQQAYEAARRWVSRPSGSHPLTGGGVVDTSRSSTAPEPVKPAGQGNELLRNP